MHVGRVGWTWYTGSAGWLHQAALQGILGLRRQGNKLVLTPRLPSRWEKVEIDYRFGKTLYHVVLENPDHVSGDRAEVELRDDGATHEVRVRLGETRESGRGR